MTGKTLAQITGNLLADTAALFGVPTTTTTELFRAFLRKQSNEALEIALDELRKGEIDALDVANEHEGIAVAYRYALAVRDGAARRNLRLLAKAMVSLAKRDRLFSDEFNKYADVLSRMTRDQILVLGRYYALAQEEAQETPDMELARSNAWKRTIGELVPAEFPDKRYVESVCSQAIGLGLIIPVSAFGGLAYSLSPIMDEIGQLVDFQDVLAAERDGLGQRAH